EILLRKPFFALTVDRARATLTSGTRVRRILNRNTLVRHVPFVDGVKTGHTAQAGYVLVGAARRGGVRLVSAVLDDPSEAARDAVDQRARRRGQPHPARRELLRPRADAPPRRDPRGEYAAAGGHAATGDAPAPRAWPPA